MAPLPMHSVFSDLPTDLRNALVEALNNIRGNYVERRWEPSELNGGKVSEVVYRIMEWHASPGGNYTALGIPIKDFGRSVRKFENDTKLSDSIRFHIPNALNFLYSVRNKRGVGYVSGDVNPNRMDAEAVLATSNWAVAELVRIFHSVSMIEARETIEGLVEKRSPLVWEVAGVRRILNPAMPYEDKVLVLLHSLHPKAANDSDLFEWCGHSNKSSFRKQVLQKADDEALVHYDKVKQQVHLSPNGLECAEQILRGYTQSPT